MSKQSDASEGFATLDEALKLLDHYQVIATNDAAQLFDRRNQVVGFVR